MRSAFSHWYAVQVAELSIQSSLVPANRLCADEERFTNLGVLTALRSEFEDPRFLWRKATVSFNRGSTKQVGQQIGKHGAGSPDLSGQHRGGHFPKGFG